MQQEAMTMLGHRHRSVKPAIALWLLVLVADAAAVGTATVLVYLLAGVVGGAIVVLGARAGTGRPDAMTPAPVPVRARVERGRR
jgi:hypothetical protein